MKDIEYLTAEEEMRLARIARRIPTCKCAETQRVPPCNRCRESADARNRVVMNCYPWVCRCAHKYAGMVPHEELVAHAMLSLVEKFDRFDVEYGVKPITYLTNVAERQMQGLTKTDGIIKRPPDVDQDRVSLFRRTQAETCRFVGSLNFVVFGDYGVPVEIGDEIPDRVTAQPGDDAAETEETERCLLRFKWLLPREREVIKMRVFHEMTLKEIGDGMGISKERVRQIEAKAKKKMKKYMKAGRQVFA